MSGVNLDAIPPPVENPTAPVGVVALPESVSVTVAVHVVWAFTGIDAGVQTTAVEVVLGDTANEKVGSAGGQFAFAE